MRGKGFLPAVILGVWLAGCSAVQADVTDPAASPPSPELVARMVPADSPVQCVPFARQATGIAIWGDAWTWWRAAQGRYARGQRPKAGAIMVLSRSKRLRFGHLAVVKRVLNDREILVDQANWLNRGQIHLNTAVRDVSPGNDWSAVRVWYTPGRRYGARTYPITGFIYPEPAGGTRAARDTAPRAKIPPIPRPKPIGPSQAG